MRRRGGRFRPGAGRFWRPSRPRRRSRAAAQPISAADLQFFETQIRPVLADRCYKCHSRDWPTRSRAGLMLDTREGMLHGGDTGPAIVPGKPEDSLIVDAISYKDADLQMPPKGDKLSDQQVADITEWIRRGAPDPRSLVAKGSSPDLRRRRPGALVVPARQEAGGPGRRGRRMVQDADRQLHPGEPRGERDEAQPAGRQVHADPPGDLRPDRPAADGDRGPAVPGRRLARTPGRRSSTACSPRRTTASAGAATGSTSPATPTRRATPRSGRTRGTRSPGPTGTT